MTDTATVDADNAQSDGDNATPPKSEADKKQSSDKSESTFTQAELERIVSERLARERKKYADYDDLKTAANQSKTLEERLTAAEKVIAERDVRDIERNGRLALSQVKAKLAEEGFSASDADGLLEQIDPARLLTNGEPDVKSIEKLATSLSKFAGRTTPDRDQGQRGGDASPGMNQIIRRAAGRSQ